MKNEVLEMIREREGRRDKLRAQADMLDAEIKVLKEALNRSQGQPSKRASTGKRDRPLNQTWTDVLKFIGSTGETSLDQIYHYAQTKSYEIRKDTIRAQMALYVNRGWLERVTDGVFKLTEAGQEKCGYVSVEAML